MSHDLCLPRSAQSKGGEAAMIATNHCACLGMH